MLTIKDALNNFNKSAENSSRFNGANILARDILKVYPTRDTLQVESLNMGVAIETLFTGKIKDNDSHGDAGNYDIKYITSKTGAHYNANTASKTKKYMMVFINKSGYQIELHDKVNIDKKPNRVEYKPNINKGRIITLAQALEIINNNK